MKRVLLGGCIGFLFALFELIIGPYVGTDIYICPGWVSRLRNENGIDDMHYSITGIHVSFCDLGVVDKDIPVFQRYGETKAVYCDNFSCFHIGSHDFSGHDVVGKDRD